MLHHVNPKVLRKARTYLVFKCGQIEYNGRLVSLSGRKLYEFPHGIYQPPKDVLNEIREDLVKWLKTNFADQPSLFNPKWLEMTTLWVYTDGPKFYHNQNHPEYQVNREKRGMYAKHTLMAWVYDIFDKFKTMSYYREFSSWSIALIGDIFEDKFFVAQQEKSKCLEVGLQLVKQEIKNSKFATLDPMLETYFRLCVTFAVELKFDWKLEKGQYLPYFKSYLRQYKHEAWQNYTADRLLRNVRLRNSLRTFTIGMEPFAELAAVLDRVQLTNKERNNKYLKRLEKLLFSQVALVNDIFSVKKEIKLNEPDNLLLLYCQYKNMTFKGSLKLLTRKHDRIHDEAQNVYNVLINNGYSENMTKFLEFVINAVDGNTIFHFLCSRYEHGLEIGKNFVVASHTAKQFSGNVHKLHK